MEILFHQLRGHEKSAKARNKIYYKSYFCLIFFYFDADKIMYDLGVCTGVIIAVYRL